LEIAWLYEPEGYSLPSGGYLPDFWLPEFDAWWEVKGEELTCCADDGSRVLTLSEKLCQELAQMTHKRVYIAWGPMPRSVDAYGESNEKRGIEYVEFAGECSPFVLDKGLPYFGGDCDYAFCACPWCGKIGLEYNGRGARVCGWETHHENYDDALAIVVKQGHWRADDKCYTANDPRIVAAYVAARSARFEHGQSGAIR
jgi:hypothetical protein